jgi:hypothetical protein
MHLRVMTCNIQGHTAERRADQRVKVAETIAAVRPSPSRRRRSNVLAAITG